MAAVPRLVESKEGRVDSAGATRSLLRTLKFARCRGGDRSGLSLAGTNPIALLDRHDEDASIADLTGPRRGHDRLDGIVGERIGHDHFDLHLRQEADVVLLAPIDRRVPFLLAVTANLGDRHAGNVQLRERVLDIIHLVRADDALDHFHEPSSMRCRSAVSACCSASVSFDPPLVMWNTSIAFSPSVAISTRSTSQPCCEITRLMR